MSRRPISRGRTRYSVWFLQISISLLSPFSLPVHLGCVTGEDKVTSFDRLVAGIAGFEVRFLVSFAVFKLSEPPAAGRGIFLGVLDHKLNIRGGASDERLGTAKDFVVFL